MKTDVHVISSNSKGFFFPPQGIVTQLHRGGKCFFFLRTWPDYNKYRENKRHTK
jgi:hypothetical protein